MKFLKQLSLYTVVGFFGAGINFFLLPVLSHHLTPRDYGIISIINSYVTILIPLVGLVATSLLSVEYYKTTDKLEFASKFVSVQMIPVIPSLLFATVFYLFYEQVSGLLELTDTNRGWSIAMVFLAFATIYVETFLNFLIFQKRVNTYALFNISKVLLEVVLTVWLVIFEKLGWEGRLYSWLITTGVYLVCSVIYFGREGFLKGKVRKQYIIEGIVFGLPLILHTVGKFVINQSDRLFIAKMISVDKAGIYNLGYTVGSLLLIVINAFFNFYTPFLMERLANMDENKKLQIVKMNYLFAAGSVTALLLLSIAAPFFFTHFVDERYETAGQYVFWVGLGYLFWGGYMLFSTYIFYYKKNGILGWLALLNVLLNIVFNYYFISWFGAIGAAYATALSFFIVFVLIALRSEKLIRLPWLDFRNAMAVKL